MSAGGEAGTGSAGAGGGDAAAAAKRRQRQALRGALSALPAAARAAGSAASAAACQSLVERLRVPALGSFLALPGEPDLSTLHAWWWSRGRPLLLPRMVADHGLAWHAVAGLDQVRPGGFGVAEPDPARCPQVTLPAGALLLVPGLGFTADGHRLGRGAGYYDRALAGFAGLAIGVAFACQRCAELPVLPHDVRLHGVVFDGDVSLRPGCGEP